MKKTVLLAASIFILQACKKENSIDPLLLLTQKNTAALKNTEWYGLYRNKGEETYGNNSGYRGYAIAFGADSAFTFYSSGFTLVGFWSVNGDTARFSFATGAQNQWKAVIKGDSVFTDFTQPLPANFSFNKTMKKIPNPPADVIGHTWIENSMSLTPFRLVFTDKSAGVGYPTPFQVNYSSPPVKNRIFNTTDKGLRYSVLMIVDYKITWTFDDTAFNFSYNY